MKLLYSTRLLIEKEKSLVLEGNSDTGSYLTKFISPSLNLIFLKNSLGMSSTKNLSIENLFFPFSFETLPGYLFDIENRNIIFKV